MRKKKNVVPPSFEERLELARQQSERAVSVFEQVARDLEATAATKAGLADELEVEMGRLLDLLDSYEELTAQARDAEADALTKATNVRALMGN